MKKMKKRFAAAALALVLMLGLAGCSIPTGSYTAKDAFQTSTATSWQMSYGYFDGYIVKRVYLDVDKAYRFTAELVVDEGEMNFALRGNVAGTVFDQQGLATSTQTAVADGNDYIDVYFSMAEASGSFAVAWASVEAPAADGG